MVASSNKQSRGRNIRTLIAKTSFGYTKNFSTIVLRKNFCQGTHYRYYWSL